MKAKLNQLLYSAIKWVALASAYKSISKFLLMIFLTNYLTAKDFGLYALINIIFLFGFEFVEMGFGQAIIQKKDINKKQLSTLYWTNLLFSVFLFLLIYFGADLISLFFNEPELTLYIKIISFSFIFFGLSTQFRAIMKKKLLLNLVSIIEIISITVFLTVTILLVNLDYGLISIVYAILLQILTRSILFIFFGLKYYKPILTLNFKETKDLLQFGFFRFGSFLTSFSMGKLDQILIPKLIGIDELGVYFLFDTIIKFPIKITTQINRSVFYPFLSKLKKYKTTLNFAIISLFKLKIIYYTFISFFIAFNSTEIIALFLNKDWTAYNLVLSVLSISIIFMGPQKLINIHMLVRNKPNWSFYFLLAQIPLIYVLIFLGGKYYGLLGISIAILLRYLIIQFPKYFIIIKKLITFKSYEYFKIYVFCFFYFLIWNLTLELSLEYIVINHLIKIIMSIILNLFIAFSYIYLFNYRVTKRAFNFLLKS